MNGTRLLYVAFDLDSSGIFVRSFTQEIADKGSQMTQACVECTVNSEQPQWQSGLCLSDIGETTSFQKTWLTISSGETFLGIKPSKWRHSYQSYYARAEMSCHLYTSGL